MIRTIALLLLIFAAPEVALAVDFTDSTIALGRRHTCAIDALRGVVCWGERGEEIETSLNSKITQPTGISINNYETCVVDHINGVDRVVCAGAKTYDASGWKSGKVEEFVPPNKSFTSILSIVADRDHTCVLDKHAGVVCWGIVTARQFNGPDMDFATTLTLPNNLPRNPKAIATDSGHIYVLDNNGNVLHWTAQTWSPPDSSNMAPASILPKQQDIVNPDAIVVSEKFISVLDQNNKVAYWTKHASQSPSTRNAPVTWDLVKIQDELPSKGLTITPGETGPCVATEDHGILCLNQDRKWAGNNMQARRLYKLLKLITKGKTTCVLDEITGLFCWGDNKFGQTDVPLLLLPALPYPLRGVAGIGFSSQFLSEGLKNLSRIVPPYKAEFFIKCSEILAEIACKDASNTTDTSSAELFVFNALLPVIADDQNSEIVDNFVTPAYKAALQEANRGKISSMIEIPETAQIQAVALRLIEAALSSSRDIITDNEQIADTEDFITSTGNTLSQINAYQSIDLSAYLEEAGAKQHVLDVLTNNIYTQSLGIMVQSILEYLRGTK